MRFRAVTGSEQRQERPNHIDPARRVAATEFDQLAAIVAVEQQVRREPAAAARRRPGAARPRPRRLPRADGRPGGGGSDASYTYVTDFTVASAAGLTLSGKWSGDNDSDVFLNGNLIGHHQATGKFSLTSATSSRQQPTHTHTTTTTRRRHHV
jgi:hypothetical protein